MITTELASRFVDVAKVPWKSTPHKGVEVKPLLVERDTDFLGNDWQKAWGHAVGRNSGL